jgi:hypothetical protein
MYYDDYRLWVTVGYFTISILILLVPMLVFLLILRKFLKLYKKSNSIFGSNTQVRLISLGIATIFFYDVLQDVFRTILEIISRYFNNVFKSIVINWQTNSELCLQESGAYLCISQLSSGYYEVFSLTITNSLENLPFISIYKIILLLAAWALISVLIDFALQHQSSTDSGKPNINNWLSYAFTNRKTATAKNIAFSLILIIGSYLSAAAIAAIPGLQEKTTGFQEIAPERLKTQIDGMAAQLDKYPNEITSKDPFNKINEFIAVAKNGGEQKNAGNKEQAPPPLANIKNEQTAPANSTDANVSKQSPPTANSKNQNTNAVNNLDQQPNEKDINREVTVKEDKQLLKPEDITYVESLTGGYQRNRQMLLGHYKNLLDNIKSQQKSDKNLAVQSYEVGNLDRKGNKERVQYFLDITEWFNRRTTNFDENLNNCLKGIQYMDSNWEAQADNLLDSIKSGDPSYEYMNYRSRIYNESLGTAFRSCPISVTLNEAFPKRPQLGDSSYLGPFGFVASWLLRTESLPLALITGLLGFGLLGSACSTFIRERISYNGEGLAQTNPPDNPTANW